MSQGDGLRELELQLRQDGSPLTNHFRQTSMTRGNTPSGAARHFSDYSDEAPTHAPQEGTIWVRDRILEPQSLAYFFACVSGVPLPNGQTTRFPVLSVAELCFLNLPLSEWAPPPYNDSQGSAMDQITSHVGCLENIANFMLATRELRMIKTLVWSGMAPISERRWRELDLDSSDKFHDACQYFCAVIDVFHYLNTPAIKDRLRNAYNAIWDELSLIDYSLNFSRRARAEPELDLAGMWCEFIDALFASMTQHAHDWVTTHIERLRGPVLQRLSDIVKDKPAVTDISGYSQEEMELLNKLHDLMENAAQADTAIFLPMDGYSGCELVNHDDVPLPDATIPYREQPISFSVNKQVRELDYYARLEYLTTYKKWKEFDSIELGSIADRLEAVSKEDSLSANQIIAQHQARMELRGPLKPLTDEQWVLMSKSKGDSNRWGFIAYRMCYDHTNEEWEEFKAKFEADISNWRNEMPDMDDIKERSVVEWKEARELGLPENDVVAVRGHFASLVRLKLIPKHINPLVILAADKAVIDSYLKPTPGQGGFVLAVEAWFDADELGQNHGGLPEYGGMVKILGSVLWDDVSASMLLQARRLDDMWVLAQDHPLELYEGYMPRHAPATEIL
ncbi:unnamed protein product [Clonostachys rosea]|uniref:Uncharacterized protein n=1 Tax=Bionectria ochroleuca TaxID=29856 RepID=A0ABY6UBX5_BIOOC|nr:unnamed protein product [Clonostachys rosea]